MIETSVRKVKTEKTLYELIKAIAAFRLRAMEIRPRNFLPYEMFKNGTPYEASRTYAIMKAEFERTKSMAVTEIHRQALSCG